MVDFLNFNPDTLEVSVHSDDGRDVSWSDPMGEVDDLLDAPSMPTDSNRSS